jgi:hypothetical protein
VSKFFPCSLHDLFKPADPLVLILSKSLCCSCQFSNFLLESLSAIKFPSWPKAYFNQFGFSPSTDQLFSGTSSVSSNLVNHSVNFM